METDFQDAGNNCFTCHNFVPDTPEAPGSALAVSHIYSSLAPASGSATPDPKAK